jgi:hypothetical protein
MIVGGGGKNHYHYLFISMLRTSYLPWLALALAPLMVLCFFHCCYVFELVSSSDFVGQAAAGVCTS